MNPNERARSRRLRLAAILIAALLAPGCGALLLVGGAGTSAIAFATGELQSEEQTSLAALSAASRLGMDRLGYSDIETNESADRIRLTATTSGGEPVDLKLHSVDPETTDLRIRIGTFGDEAASRLLLEEIHQSL